MKKEALTAQSVAYLNSYFQHITMTISLYIAFAFLYPKVHDSLAAVPSKGLINIYIYIYILRTYRYYYGTLKPYYPQ